MKQFLKIVSRFLSATQQRKCGCLVFTGASQENTAEATELET